MMDHSANQNCFERLIMKGERAAIHPEEVVSRMNSFCAPDISRIRIDAPIGSSFEFAGKRAGPAAKIKDAGIRSHLFAPEDSLFSAKSGFEDPAQGVKNHGLLRHPVHPSVKHSLILLIHGTV